LVSVTCQFAKRADLAIEPGSKLLMKTVGGHSVTDVAYAKTVAVSKAQAFGVVVAVNRETDPFGQLDDLLGMSFLSRFKVTVSPKGLELTAIPIDR